MNIVRAVPILTQIIAYYVLHIFMHECMYVCMYVCRCIYMCVCLYVCTYVCMSVYLSVCLCVYIHVCMYVFLYVSIRLYVCISVYLSVCLSVFLSLSLFFLFLFFFWYVNRPSGIVGMATKPQLQIVSLSSATFDFSDVTSQRLGHVPHLNHLNLSFCFEFCMNWGYGLFPKHPMSLFFFLFFFFLMILPFAWSVGEPKRLQILILIFGREGFILQK